MLMAAIEAVASIRPQEAAQILIDLTQSEDQDIAEAASESIAMTEVFLDIEDDDIGDEFLQWGSQQKIQTYFVILELARLFNAGV